MAAGTAGWAGWEGYKASQRIENRNATAQAYYDRSNGKAITENDPATGRPFILDDITRYRKDFRETVPDAFTVGKTSLDMVTSPYSIGKKTAEAAAGRQFCPTP